MNSTVKKWLLGLSLGLVAATSAPAFADPDHGRGPPPWAPAHGERAKEDWRRGRDHDWDRPDRGGYYADRYYRDGRHYRPMRLSRETRIYRGYDGRYYCRRSDGTTGLIVGAAVGGLLGNQLDRGGSGLLGTIVGGTAGALLGREVDRGGISCR